MYFIFSLSTSVWNEYGLTEWYGMKSLSLHLFIIKWNLKCLGFVNPTPMYFEPPLTAFSCRREAARCFVSVLASTVQYVERSFFLISYFGFRFTNEYILFCCLRRIVQAFCHKCVTRRHLLTMGDGRRISVITYTPPSKWRHTTVQQWSMAKPDIGRKSRFLSELVGIRRNIAITFGVTRMTWLPDGEKNLKICLFISTQYTNVTDRQTDTTRRHRPRLCMASRGKNYKNCNESNTIRFSPHKPTAAWKIKERRRLCRVVVEIGLKTRNLILRHERGDHLSICVAVRHYSLHSSDDTCGWCGVKSAGRETPPGLRSICCCCCCCGSLAHLHLKPHTEHLYSPRMVEEIKEEKNGTSNSNKQTVIWPNYLNYLNYSV